MNGRELIIGVTGGIAAYKTAALVSRLVQAGAGVSVVMTAAATRFVGPTTFAALTGRPVGTSVFDQPEVPLGAHIQLAEKADLLCVAPATANFLAKAAHGIADDLLSTLYLSIFPPERVDRFEFMSLRLVYYEERCFPGNTRSSALLLTL